MIVAIDPSYTRTGVCITSDDASEIYYKGFFEADVDVYKEQGYITGCKRIYGYLLGVLEEQHEQHLDEEVRIICEYPAWRSRTGAWLGVLHGWLSCLFEMLPMQVAEVVWIPPTACDSYVKNKGHRKSYLTKYCVDKGWVEKKVNHDISTAIIFAHLYLDVVNGNYKNVVYRWQNGLRV